MQILIADDHAIVRRGLKLLLLEEYPSSEIGEAGDAETLIKEVIRKNWDLIISDISMPGRSGLDSLIQIKQIRPELPVLIMSMHPEEQYALRVFKAGASGYLGKDTIHDDIIKAIQTVMAGKKFINHAVAEKLTKLSDKGKSDQLHEKLSDREFDVFKMLASGKSVSEIAVQFSLSVTTVSTYRSRILEKMNMRSNADLTRYALEKQLI